MGSAIDLLDALWARGISVSARGADLVLEPASALSDDDRRMLRANKAALLRVLSSHSTYSADQATDLIAATFARCASYPHVQAGFVPDDLAGLGDAIDEACASRDLAALRRALQQFEATVKIGVPAIDVGIVGKVGVVATPDGQMKTIAQYDRPHRGRYNPHNPHNPHNHPDVPASGLQGIGGQEAPPPAAARDAEDDEPAADGVQNRAQTRQKRAETDQKQHVSGTFSPPSVHLVTTHEALLVVLPALCAAERLGIDFETTGKDGNQEHGRDPILGTIRLVQLATPTETYLFDAFRVDIRALAPVFETVPLFIGHNLAFELRFMMQAGLPIAAGERLVDTMLVSQLLDSGRDRDITDETVTGLGHVAERYLGVNMDKTEQRSDWSGTLSQAQLDYAALDAAIMLPLHDVLCTELVRAGLVRVFGIEMRCLPFMAWLASTGAPFDVEAWTEVGQAAKDEAAAIKTELDTILGTGDHVNWGSPSQIRKLVTKRGYAVESAREEILKELADLGEALAQPLMRYRAATKRAGTYGAAWLKYVHPVTKRIYSSTWQIGTVAGRMSHRAPNLQNIPRDPVYRSKFKPKAGRALIKVDYSQIELRYLAQMSREPVLVAAFLRGDDLYALTARMLDCERQTAKAVDLGVDCLREKIQADTGRDVPRETVAAWHAQYFARRPVLRQWQQKLGNAPSTETRTLTGRRRLGVTGYCEKINSPVQGSACDGLKVAPGLLWETRARCPDAAPTHTVHDEVVFECDAATAECTREWVEDGLVRGARAVLGDGPGAVPITVDSKICQDWSGTPLSLGQGEEPA